MRHEGTHKVVQEKPKVVSQAQIAGNHERLSALAKRSAERRAETAIIETEEMRKRIAECLKLVPEHIATQNYIISPEGDVLPPE